jgi:NADPH:quinone reductase-like Zn-dependent oxidoreductase
MNKTSLLFKLGLVRKLTNLIQSGVLSSEIAQTFSLDEVRQAMMSAEDSSKLGKTLLKIGE